jgi:hypothetical protein
MASALQALSSGLQGGGGASQGSNNAGINLGGANTGNNTIGLNTGGGSVLGASTVASSSPASTGTTMNNPEYLQGIQQEYGATIANAQRQVPYYEGLMNTLQGNTTAQAAQQTGDENNNFTAANNAYNTQNQATQSQQQLSLAELADQIHGQNQGLTNQLGTLGAGSSSAVGTGQNALAKVQNTDRANIQQQAGAGTAEINAAQQSLLTQHQSNLDQIQQYKTNQLNNILGTYTPLIQNINASMAQAQGEEKARLAIYGQNLTQQAGAALQKLDGDVSSLTNASVRQVQENLTPETVNAAPSAVGVPTVSPFNVGNAAGAGNTTAAPTGGSLSSLLQQNQPTTP